MTRRLDRNTGRFRRNSLHHLSAILLEACPSVQIGKMGFGIGKLAGANHCFILAEDTSGVCGILSLSRSTVHK